MRTFITLLVSAGLTVAGLGAAIVLHGGWESAAAAGALVAAMAFLFSLILALVAGERPTPKRPAWAATASSRP
jgi:O-antigen/teichoic acid export membrane protein